MADETDTDIDGEDELPEGITLAHVSADDPRQVKERKTASKRRAAQNAEVISGLLATEKGRAFLADILLVKCGMFLPTMNAAWDSHGQAFREGQRAISLVMHAEMLQADKKGYMLMLQENVK